MVSQISQVKKYYDSTLTDYKLLWTDSKGLAIHFGYYDKGVKNHKQAVLKTNEVLARLVAIKPTDFVLDAGCGLGGSAIWLAQNIGCRVVGITIVPHQVETAQKFVKKYQLENKIDIQNQNYCQTNFDDQSFDVVWALESIVHAQDKKDFIDEAFRLLRKDGRIIIAEYTLRDHPPLSIKERKIIAPWLKGWAMPNLLTANEYKKLLKKTGFKKIRSFDITNKMRPSLARLNRLSKFAMPLAKLLYKLRIFNKERFGNIEGSTYQMKALAQQLWSYTVVTAKR